MALAERRRGERARPAAHDREHGMNTAPWTRAGAALGAIALPAAALAQTPPAPVQLAPVVVTATRTEAQAFDVPASIDRVGSETIHEAKPQINISESLGGVPGVLARDRQN